ncbi:MAG: hypothetical protein IJ828_02910 [Treponema sp.]|nr:hypothetical protein [Treponema sp.]
MHNQFTCISYDTIDFLIPSQYVVSGIFLSIPKDSKTILFNRETLPHIYIGNMLEKEFLCKSKSDTSVVLVMNKNDFSREVCQTIINHTDTAFPATGNLALSVNGNISSKEFILDSFHLMPQGIRDRLRAYGIDAIIFPDSTRKQILIAPDLLLKKFFTGGIE